MEEFRKKGMDEKGLSHVFAAFGYSMAGARVLMREEAARLEIVLFSIAVVLFAVTGAVFWQYLVLLGLLLFVLCVEALNTALELVVDRVSPEISDFGKQTKDIASFAVFCALTIFCGYALWVILPF
jgi:diacylglycerol kinase (ATP)